MLAVRFVGFNCLLFCSCYVLITLFGSCLALLLVVCVLGICV